MRKYNSLSVQENPIFKQAWTHRLLIWFDIKNTYKTTLNYGNRTCAQLSCTHIAFLSFQELNADCLHRKRRLQLNFTFEIDFVC